MNLKAQRVGCEVARNRHYDRAVVQRQRLLSMVAVIGGSVTAGFGVMQLIFSNGFGYIGFVNLGTVALYALIHRCIDSVSWSRHSLDHGGLCVDDLRVLHLGTGHRC